MKVLFANPPWWTVDAIPNQPGRSYLRRGIRAGSRWPFTQPSGYAPDQFKFGNYLPAPFFLASAAAYAQAELKKAGEVHGTNGVYLRDSIARGESYQSFFNYLTSLKPDLLVIETGAAAWQHDAELIAAMKHVVPGLQVAVAGPTAANASKEDGGSKADAFLLGEYEKNAMKFIRGARGLIQFDLLSRDEMNTVPYPMWDEVAALHYWDACPKGQTAPHLQVMTSRGCPYKCLSGDTLVNTIYGDIPIRTLAEKYKEVPVFTYDPAAKKAKICTARNIMKLGEGEKLVRVHMDDGSHIDCTPDHRFLVFKIGNQFVDEREWEIEAKDLKKGMRLRSLKFYPNGAYPSATWSRRGRAMVHRMVMEWKLRRPLSEEEVVHHIDHNKANFHPDNLQLMANAKEHFSEHPEVAERMRNNNPTRNGVGREWRINLSRSQTGKVRSPEARENYRQAAILREARKSPEQKSADAQRMIVGYQEAKPWTNRGRNSVGQFVDTNHRVAWVEELPGAHDVYCLEVPETHWFYANRTLVSNCVFCAWPATMTGNDPDGTKARSIRFHSAEWVEGMIRSFLAEHPETRSIYLDDDTFNLTDKHTREICEVMKRIGLPWSAMCRADTCTRETWMIMRDSGCFGVKIGFESGSQRVVDEIVNKRLNLVDAATTAQWLRSIGMTVHGTFTIGLPGETEKEVEETKEFIQRLYRTGCLDTHQLSGTATIEGTPLDSISQGGSLKAYPGASAGEAFVRDHDGVKKVEGMT